MSYLPSRPDLQSLNGIIDLYPRRGILLFKLMDGIKDSFSAHNPALCNLLIQYLSNLNGTEAGDPLDTGFPNPTPVEDSADNPFNESGAPEKLKPILRFVKKLTLTPEQIAEADVIPIFDAGWDERTLLDAISLCAIVNCMDLMASGIGLYNYPAAGSDNIVGQYSLKTKLTPS